jgi:hypothetical protein
MFVSCTVFVLSDRGLCDAPIPRPGESYRLWCVSDCDQVKTKQRRRLLWLGRRGTDYETKLVASLAQLWLWKELKHLGTVCVCVHWNENRKFATNLMHINLIRVGCCDNNWLILDRRVWVKLKQRHRAYTAVLVIAVCVLQPTLTADLYA